MIEKNHKHEIGVEIAHHKETQKNYNKLNEEYKELKTKLEVNCLNFFKILINSFLFVLNLGKRKGIGYGQHIFKKYKGK